MNKLISILDTNGDKVIINITQICYIQQGNSCSIIWLNGQWNDGRTMCIYTPTPIVDLEKILLSLQIE